MMMSKKYKNVDEYKKKLDDATKDRTIKLIFKSSGRFFKDFTEYLKREIISKR